MVRLKMAETVKEAVTFVEQGHIRVGPEVVTDPAFLVTRSMEDFVTWVDTSKIKRKILKYNDKVIGISFFFFPTSSHSYFFVLFFLANSWMTLICCKRYIQNKLGAFTSGLTIQEKDKATDEGEKTPHLTARLVTKEKKIFITAFRLLAFRAR